MQTEQKKRIKQNNDERIHKKMVEIYKKHNYKHISRSITRKPKGEKEKKTIPEKWKQARWEKGI